MDAAERAIRRLRWLKPVAALFCLQGTIALIYGGVLLGHFHPVRIGAIALDVALACWNMWSWWKAWPQFPAVRWKLPFSFLGFPLRFGQANFNVSPQFFSFSPTYGMGMAKWKRLHEEWVANNSASRVCLRPTAEATACAMEMVKRLAPNVRVLKPSHGFLCEGSSSHVYQADGVLLDNVGHTECCSMTFCHARDADIPYAERALTIYLWKKLFPQRYRMRPLSTRWSAGIPLQ